MSRPILRPLLAVATLLFSCATPNQAVSESSARPGLTRDEDLSAAFDAPADEASTRGAPVAENNVPPLPEPPDPSAAPRARFAAVLSEAEQKVQGGDLPGARKALAQLEGLSAAAGGSARAQVKELAFEVEAAAGSGGEAKAAERWLSACGPDELHECRGRALEAYATLEKAKAAPIQRADVCLEQAEEMATAKRPRLPGCLDAAQATYRSQDDALMLLRAATVRAQAAGAEPRKLRAAAEELAKAEDACSEPRCVDSRRKALGVLSSLNLRQGQPEAATQAALDMLKLMASTTAFGRPLELDEACLALDAKAGQGACRKLEKERLGRYSFRDFSKEQLGEGLPKDKILPVNEHFGVLIQECLAARAAQLVPPSSATYKVRWLVLNDGKVDAVHLEPKDQDQGPLASCLRKQFAHWRYPRYSGEWHHVEQSFTISATQRQ